MSDYCYDAHLESILEVLWKIENRLSDMDEFIKMKFKPTYLTQKELREIAQRGAPWKKEDELVQDK